MSEGYYWAICPTDGTWFVAKLEEGKFYTVGIENPIDLDESDIICRVDSPTMHTLQ